MEVHMLRAEDERRSGGAGGVVALDGRGARAGGGGGDVLVVGAGEDGAGEGREAGGEGAALDVDVRDWFGGDGPVGRVLGAGFVMGGDRGRT